MRWIHAEYLLKGIFVALVGYAGFVARSGGSAAILLAFMFFGVAAGLFASWIMATRRGIRPGGRASSFFMFLLLEYPRNYFVAILASLFAALMVIRREDVDQHLLPVFLAAGSALGMAFIAFQYLKDSWQRLWIALFGAAAIVAGMAWWMSIRTESLTQSQILGLGTVIAACLPFFALLSWVSEREESEVELATGCAMMSLAIWFMQPPTVSLALAFALPAMLYFFLARRVLSHVQVWKLTLRGLGLSNSGRPGEAIALLRRATELSPDDPWARSSLWEIHRNLDTARIVAEPELAQLIDPRLCMDRVRALLTEPPTSSQRAESQHLLNIVDEREVRWRPETAYWRAVAALHAGEVAAAADLLTDILNRPASQSRSSILYPAWQLIIAGHSELESRVARSQLTIPGRRMEAIAAVESVLTNAPQDGDAWGMKRVLYAGLTTNDVTTNEPFDAGYVEQLGLALLDDAQRFRRGVDYLSLAAHRLPAEAPRLLGLAADALEKHGDAIAAGKCRNQGVSMGRTAGHKQLSEPNRAAFFGLVKRLADDAVARGDLEDAIHHYQLLSESDRSGIETLRKLADLHESRGDALSALHAVELARVYNAKDPDLLARRDKYHYSVVPADLPNVAEHLRGVIDTDYCIAKARQLLDLREADDELLDWARHLSELALTLRPNGIVPRTVSARVQLRLGERDRALQLLEDVREAKPAKFSTSADEEAWQLTNKLLGELYLNELDRPDLAIHCFADYRTSSKSGADTLYKLGLAHERIGDRARAAKFFEQVTSYAEHPLAPDARDALRRVRA